MTLLLSGCSTAINISAPESTIKPHKSLSSKKPSAAIIVSKSQAAKRYQFAAKKVAIYPGLSEGLQKRLLKHFSSVDVLSAYRPSQKKYDYVIYPDWEIERENLNVKLFVSLPAAKVTLPLSETAQITKRSGTKAMGYILASTTIVGYPLALNIDNKDIAQKIKSSLTKIIINHEGEIVDITKRFEKIIAK